MLSSPGGGCKKRSSRILLLPEAPVENALRAFIFHKTSPEGRLTAACGLNLSRRGFAAKGFSIKVGLEPFGLSNGTEKRGLAPIARLELSPPDFSQISGDVLAGPAASRFHAPARALAAQPRPASPGRALRVALSEEGDPCSRSPRDVVPPMSARSAIIWLRAPAPHTARSKLADCAPPPI